MADTNALTMLANEWEARAELLSFSPAADAITLCAKQLRAALVKATGESE